MGNIETLKRQGWTSASPSLAGNTGLGTMDDLVYTYNSGNKLTNVADNNASDTYGFVDANGSGTEYTYDVNGNMISDANKGITSISYNHLNLPTNISINGNGNTGTIAYIYDATGVKLKKTVGSSVTEYAGNHIYQNGSLQFFNQPEGYVNPHGQGGYEYVYQYKDHLGNVRLSFVDNNGTTEIVDENNYYPFGLKHKGYNEAVSPLGNSVANKWKYNGKELMDDLDLAMYDYGARFYDPAVGRWFTPDALAEKYYDQSTYTYTLNNPILFVDPDGNQVEMCCEKLKAYVGAIVAGGTQGHKNFVNNAIKGGIRTISLSLARTTATVNGDFGTVANLNQTQLNETVGGLVSPIVNTIEGGKDIANGNVVEGVAKLTEVADGVAAAVATEGAGRALGTLGKVDNVKTITIDANRFPESAAHLQDAIDAGIPNTGVVDRAGANARRKSNLDGVERTVGKDRDEAPPAVINTGSAASVRAIDMSDNRGSGSLIGHQLKGVEDGTRVRIIPINNKK